MAAALLLRSFFFWFGAIWLLAGALVARSGAAGLQAARASRSTQGVVVAKSMIPANREDNYRTRYEIAYRFAAEGRDYQRVAEVDAETWEGLIEGGPVRVAYLPDEFHTSRLDEFGSAGEIVALILGALIAATGGYLVVREVRKAVAGASAGEVAPLPMLSFETLAPLLRTAWNIAKILAIVAAAGLIAELAPPVRQAAVYIDARQSRLLPVAVAVAGVGFVLMMGGILHMVAVSQQSSDSFTFQEIKDAWRARAYRTSMIWRRRLIIATGAGLLAFGITGLFVVIGPAWIKLIMMAAIFYAVARTALGIRG